MTQRIYKLEESKICFQINHLTNTTLSNRKNILRSSRTSLIELKNFWRNLRKSSGRSFPSFGSSKTSN